MLLAHKVKEGGKPVVGGQATGFVISKERRLVATAAHVADDLAGGDPMYAIVDGAAHAYEVVAVWYHPALKRKLDRGLHVRSDDPTVGSLVLGRTDIAVFELSSDGPELPVELELAADPVLKILSGQAAGVLGYAAMAGAPWPTSSRAARAKYATAIIGSILHDDDNENAPIEERRMMWYDPYLGAGSSGCPLFLPNGQVAGLTVGGSVGDSSPGCAIRVDALRELLAWHGLATAEPGWLAAARKRADWGNDRRVDDYRRAIELVSEADRLRRAEDYLAAQTRCNEALALAPDYGRALLERSKVFLFCAAKHWDELTPELRQSYVEQSYHDSYRARELYWPWNEANLINLQSTLYCVAADRDQRDVQGVVRELDRMLKEEREDEELTNWQRGFLFSLRGQAFGCLGEVKKAEDAYAESIRVCPAEPRWYLNRAQFWDTMHKPERAAQDRKLAEEVTQGRQQELVAETKPPIPRPETPALPSDASSPFELELDGPAAGASPGPDARKPNETGPRTP
jgi:hypothetical protein